MTTEQVYDKIKPADEGSVSIVIFSTVNYWGHHNKSMWEWLALD